eukprot:jgi/Botrbrau1/7937/Bobra.9_2s0096.1
MASVKPHYRGDTIQMSVMNKRKILPGLFCSPSKLCSKAEDGRVALAQTFMKRHVLEIQRIAMDLKFCSQVTVRDIGCWTAGSDCSPSTTSGPNVRNISLGNKSRPVQQPGEGSKTRTPAPKDKKANRKPILSRVKQQLAAQKELHVLRENARKQRLNTVFAER